MGLRCLEISHVELDFGEAKKRLVIELVVSQGLLIVLESCLVALLHVFDLAEDEVKDGTQVFDVLPIRHEVAALGSHLVLEELDRGLAQLSTQTVLLLDEIVLGQVIDAERVARIDLEGPLEVLDGLITHFEVVHIGRNLDDSNRGECHRVAWI